MSEDHIEDLKRSKLLVGELSPVIIDFDGEILAGASRTRAGFERTYKVDSQKLAAQWNIPLKVAKERIRINSNIQRKVSREETQATLLVMAKAFEEQGVPKEEIALKVGENCPWSKNYVWELLPDEYKHQGKVEAGQKGGEERATKLEALEPVSENKLDSGSGATLSVAKPQDSRQPIQDMKAGTCEGCGIFTYLPHEYNQHLLCISCLDKAETDPEYFTRKFKLKQKVEEVVKPEPRTPSIETPEHRVAVMHPQSSAMEEKIVMRLRAKGLNIWTDEVLCVEGTKPDFNIQLPNGRIARGYDDGPVHSPRRRDRDEYLRRQWLKHHPDELVVSVDTVGDSDGEADEKTAEIMKKLGLET